MPRVLRFSRGLQTFPEQLCRCRLLTGGSTFPKLCGACSYIAAEVLWVPAVLHVLCAFTVEVSHTISVALWASVATSTSVRTN